MRKLIQLASAPAGLFGLCDDGTVWVLIADQGWVRAPDVPQDSAQSAREYPVWGR